MENALVLIQSWIQSSKSKVRVIPRINREDECNILLGITERSVLGTIINHTGGLSVFNGCIRHWGGNNSFEWSIAEANSLCNRIPKRIPGVLLVADDYFGGIFGINYDHTHDEPGTIIYLPPESYTWYSMGIGHSEFVQWSMTDKVSLFYAAFEKLPRPNVIPFNKTLDYSPPLWISDRSEQSQIPPMISSYHSLKIRVGLLNTLFRTSLN